MPAEVHFNQRDQVAGYLDDARAIVEEIGLPPELYAKGFELAVSLLSAKQTFVDPSEVTSPIVRAAALQG